MKKILLHGCSGKGTTNFGDFLFSDIVYKYIKDKYTSYEIMFWDLSDFFRSRIKDSKTTSFFDIFKINALIYLPGGYFSEKSHLSSFRRQLWRIKRYLVVGLIAAIMNKKIAIIGVGAGPLHGRLIKKIVKFIFNRAELVTVRDEESREFLESIGVKKNIHVTADLLMSFDLCRIKQLDRSEKNSIKNEQEGQKVLLVHYNNDHEAMKKYADAVKQFIGTKNEYRVVVASDSIVKNENDLYNEFKRLIENEQIYLYKYNDPWELCGLINFSDCILTSKLHVGIVALRLGKSVISIPIHPQKTQRLYNQINEGERCLALDNATSIEIGKLLYIYHNKSISLSDEVIKASMKNWEYLDSFLNKL